MFGYPLFFIMNFCNRKKILVSRSLTVLYTVIEKIRKIFLSRNLSLNMLKNVLFL